MRPCITFCDRKQTKVLSLEKKNGGGSIYSLLSTLPNFFRKFRLVGGVPRPALHSFLASGANHIASSLRHTYGGRQ